MLLYLARKLRLHGIITKLVNGIADRPECQIYAGGGGRGEVEKSHEEEMIFYKGSGQQWPPRGPAGEEEAKPLVFSIRELVAM